MHRLCKSSLALETEWVETDDNIREDIRNDGYVVEMTEKAYNGLAAQKVYESLDAQGCFDEVKGQIVTTVQETDGV